MAVEASEFRSVGLKELAQAIERILFASADHIVAVSEAVRDYLHSIAPETPVTVIPNGVDVELFAKGRRAVYTM